MTIKEVINQLESLKADAVERIDPEDEDDVFKKDVEALDKAIAVLQFGVAARGESERRRRRYHDRPHHRADGARIYDSRIFYRIIHHSRRRTGGTT